MENKISEFRQKSNDLIGKSFTDDFKNNALLLDVEFDNLKIEVDRDSLYTDGGIMGICVDLNEHNKSILSKFIKDFDSYNQLVDLQYHSAKKENQTDLISIIDYHETFHRQELLYNFEKEYFFYKSFDE